MAREGATGRMQTAANAVLAAAVASSAGGATGSLAVTLAAFAGLLVAPCLSGRALRALASTPFGEKALVVCLSLVSSVTVAASLVGAFGVLVAGHVTLNMVLRDLGLAELDAPHGMVPFVGIVAYCAIPALPGAFSGAGRHPMRAVTRGVTAAALAAVVLFMAHAVMRLLWIGT